MDIDLLSKMVKELILDNDRVVLPGLGCFVAEMVPSTFSDKGYTINPPYRRLYFRSRPDQGDVLTRLYAESNGIELEIADKIITDFVSELKEVLFEKKNVVFPGLGRLRATKENAVFFVADEDLDIYPAGFGLESVSLKTHQESAAEVTAAVEGLKLILEDQVQESEPVVELEPEAEPVPVAEPESEPVVQPVCVEPEPVPEQTIDQDIELETAPLPKYHSEKEFHERRKSPFMKVLKAIFAIVAVLALLLGLYIAVAKIAPEWLDRLLYTKVQLEILNYKP